MKKIIEELLRKHEVDKFHIEYWEKTSEEENADECLVKINMEKQYF